MSIGFVMMPPQNSRGHSCLIVLLFLLSISLHSVIILLLPFCVYHSSCPFPFFVSYVTVGNFLFFLSIVHSVLPRLAVGARFSRLPQIWFATVIISPLLFFSYQFKSCEYSACIQENRRKKKRNKNLAGRIGKNMSQMKGKTMYQKWRMSTSWLPR
ncbi:hypothetical protein VTN02DRAFT_6828 [Thermoascus thermophilus]